jgi:hypothetical protein
MDANLYIGPADQVARDEHVAIELIYHFFNQTGRSIPAMRELLRDGTDVLRAFTVFDTSRQASEGDEFHVFIFGTYDGEPLAPIADDELPGGPCGRSVNEIKRRLYEICRRLDGDFHDRTLSEELQQVESRFLRPTAAKEYFD